MDWSITFAKTVRVVAWNFWFVMLVAAVVGVVPTLKVLAAATAEAMPVLSLPEMLNCNQLNFKQPKRTGRTICKKPLTATMMATTLLSLLPSQFASFKLAFMMLLFPIYLLQCICKTLNGTWLCLHHNAVTWCGWAMDAQGWMITHKNKCKHLFGIAPFSRIFCK
jgi:hypothetical protein